MTPFGILLTVILILIIIIVLVARHLSRQGGTGNVHRSNMHESANTGRSSGFWWLWGAGSAMNTNSGSDPDNQNTVYDSESRKFHDQSFDLSQESSSGECASDSFSGDCSDSGGSGDCGGGD